MPDLIVLPRWRRVAALMMTTATLALPVQALEVDRMFKEVDINNDGYIDRKELTMLREKAFDRHDANRDGALTAEEMASRRPDGNPSGMFLHVDTDGDGSASREEFLASPMPLLDTADANGDGRIDQQEFQRHRDSFREMMSTDMDASS